MTLKKYSKRPDQTVTAIQLDLDIERFTYRKWGDLQTAKSGDWLVNNNGDIYTVDRQVFAATYRNIAPATFRKITIVWARPAEQDGSIETREGRSHYKVGDYIVSNDPDESDAWCVEREMFHKMYQRVEDS